MYIEGETEAMEMNRAILTVSYGVRDVDEMRASVLPVQRAIERVFPDCVVFHALACNETVDYLKARGESAYTCAEGISELENRGFKDICIAPVLLAPGRVYSDLLKAAGNHPVGRPLMDETADFEHLGRLYGAIAASAGRDVLLMGHGSDRAEGDACYLKLKDALPQNVHLACRSGSLRLEDVVRRLQRDRGLLLMPLMLTAGSHARNEMAGDGSHSWKGILRAMGFDVEVRLQGMGSISGIQEMFAGKVIRAMGG